MKTLQKFSGFAALYMAIAHLIGSNRSGGVTR